MKLAVIMGSPRKRDGWAIAERFIGELAAREPVETDWIVLQDEDIGDCRGCGACFRFGEGRCPVRDGLPVVLARIKAAEAVVFASPEYACQVTAQFKRQVGRLAWLFHRPGLDGKPAALLVTTGGGGIRPTLRYLELAAAGWGCRVAARLSVASTFYFDRPAPGFYELYLFQGLRARAAFSEADTAYWRERGWTYGDWYRPVRLGPAKRAFSRGLAAALAWFGRMVAAKSERRAA